MKQQDRRHLPYRACVGITLFNNHGHVFLGQRLDTMGAWQMPQGGIDDGESVEEAALRELKEEVGTDKADIVKIHHEKLRYEFPANFKNPYLKDKYRGQEQTWVALKFTGNDNEIDINAFDPPEFRDWCWSPLHDITKLIVPFKRDVYKEVITAFEDLV